MKIDKKVTDRLEELINRGEEIRKSYKGHPGGSFSFNSTAAVQWKVNCMSFLKTVFNGENTYSKQFDEHFDISSQNGMIFFGEVVSVIRAAKEDYENDYLFNTRALIEAEVFDDFLEQAEELLRKKYHGAAAVITGCVLEDGLRKLCKRNGITVIIQGTTSIPVDDATIDPMNVELAKRGIYNSLLQKRITTLADLRNKAAHGKWTLFTKKDVENMIRDVRDFLTTYFS